MSDPKPNERRFFLCTGHVVRPSDIYKDQEKYKDAHILGELRYVTFEGRKVTALAIYDKPVSAMTVPPVNPVIVNYTLVSPIVKCRHADCTRVQRWEIGQSGMMALMARMGLQDKYLELEEQKAEKAGKE